MLRYKNYTLLLEFHKDLKNSIYFRISKNFKRILSDIKENKLSEYLLSIPSNKKNKFPISYIDIDAKDPSFITYLNNVDIPTNMKYGLEFELDPWTNPKRQRIKVGRAIRQFFISYDNNYLQSVGDLESVEDFVNKYKSSYIKNMSNAFKNFEIVEGKDLVYWYDCNNYDKNEGSLGISCMKYATYLQMYEENPEKVKLLIYKNEDGDKIKGRALLWNLDYPKGKKLLDSIYTTDNYLVELFLSYAKNKKYLYKSHQGMGSDIIDSETGEKVEKVIVYVDDKDYNYYPYLDTLIYYNNGKLSNYDDSGDSIILNDISGGYSENEEVDSRVLYDELMHESLESIARNYGMDAIFRSGCIDDDKFMNDYIHDETSEYYHYDTISFLSLYSNDINDILYEEEILKATIPCFFDEFMKQYKNEIQSFMEKKYKFIYENDFVEELKAKINEDVIREIIEYIGNDKNYYNDIFLKYGKPGWYDRLTMAVFENLDGRYEIIESILKKHYKNFDAEEIYNNIYGRDNNNGISMLENYIDKDKLAKWISGYED